MSANESLNTSPLINVVIQESTFNLAIECDRLTAMLGDQHLNMGALASFAGNVRAVETNLENTDQDDINAYGEFRALEIEHYPAMTQLSIESIVLKANQRWPFLGCMVIHRVGRLDIADPIVLVLVASSHRKEAFAACEYIIDYLKNAAPFWKKAIFEHGEQWVNAKASDALALDKWA